MKITDLTATTVAVPYAHPLRWSLGTSHKSVKTIIELTTDEGITGVGEISGPAEAAIAMVKDMIIGSDPFLYSQLLHRLGASTRSFWAAASAITRSGIEMACVDIVGKALAMPACDVLGGSVRDSVETCAIVYFRHNGDDGRPDEMTPPGVAARVAELVADHGYRSVKLHGGVLTPDEELECLHRIQELTPDMRLRWDPNGAWSVETSVRVAGGLDGEDLNLEYLEDPTQHLEGMARVREKTDIPLATNMCVVDFGQLAPAIRLGSVDVVLADIGYWGGFRANQQMMAVCDAFRLGIGLHAHSELAVARAAMVHLALIAPSMAYAIDDHGIDLTGDVAQGLPVVDGLFHKPTAPGLGVELDRDAMARYSEMWASGVGLWEEFGDGSRPDWVPAMPLF